MPHKLPPKVVTQEDRKFGKSAFPRNPSAAILDAYLTSRERQLSSALELLREYRLNHLQKFNCDELVGFDDRCPICIKADSLLGKETK